MNSFESVMFVYYFLLYQRLHPQRPQGKHKMSFFFSIYVKISCLAKYPLCCALYFFLAISFGRVVVPSHQIAKNLPRTFEKLHWFSDQRVPTVQTDKHPDSLLLPIVGYLKWVHANKPPRVNTLLQISIHSIFAVKTVHKRLLKLITGRMNFFMHLLRY